MLFEDKKKIRLEPVFNRRNGQINFSLRKTSLPKSFKTKLKELKSINVKMEDFEFR